MNQTELKNVQELSDAPTIILTISLTLLAIVSSFIEHLFQNN